MSTRTETTTGHLRPYQQQAIADLDDLYDGGHHRASLVLPCGTGKTITATTLTATADRVATLVPTIALALQTAEHLQKARPTTRLILVCAPTPAAITDPADDTPVDTVAALLPNAHLTTNPDTLTSLLTEPGPVTLVATYASHPVLADATSRSQPWDYLICDEAHHTAGVATKTWAQVLDTGLLPTSRHLFLTATPRELATSPDAVAETGEPLAVASMTNPGLYGPLVQPLTLRDAIDAGYLSDYRVAVVTVTETDIADLRATADGEPLDPHTVATQVALLRYASTHPHVNAAIAFHNRVTASTDWASHWDTLTGQPHVPTPPGGATCTHIDGTTPRNDRDAALTGLADTPPGTLNVVTNCRVLSEGVDVPALDAVVFAQPRTSAPDIVQVVGRCLRPHPHSRSRRAVIVIPVLVPDQHQDPIETAVTGSGYTTVWQVLTALAHEDTALYRQLAYLRTHPGAPQVPGEEPLVEFDDAASLTPDLVAQWRLRILNRTTSGWVVFAAKMSNHLNRGGDPYPRRGYTLPDGYPLGERAAQVRDLHAANRLHPQIAAHIENTLPEWDWNPPARRDRRTFSEWADLLDLYVTRTGSRFVPEYALITTETGDRVPIGRWLTRQRRRWAKLTTEQQEAITKTLNIDPDRDKSESTQGTQS